MLLFSESFLDVILLFFICSFLGWCLECVYKSVITNQWVNSGMLKGPLCPIYGFGGVFAVLFNYMLFENTAYSGVMLYFMQFIIFALIMTLIEYIGGKVLLDKKGMMLWDYSNEWMNFEALVCPKFSFYWGLASLVMIYLIQPMVIQLLAAPSLMNKFLYATLLSMYLIVSLVQAVSSSSNNRFR